MIKLLRLSLTLAITLLALSSNKKMRWDDPTRWHTILSLSSQRNETTRFTIKNYWPLFTRSATSVITFKAISTSLRSSRTMPTSGILLPNSLSRVAKPVGPFFLSTFDYEIIPKPGKINKADALSWRPDYKEGIAFDNAERILLTPDKFRIQALQTTAIPIPTNTELKAAIQEAIQSDRLAGQLLKEILLSGPRSITKGLQEWNYENGLILHKGLVYVPKNDNLKRRVVQQFHDNITGHPGEWKTLELITKEYIKGCATCQTTKIRPPVKVPLKPNEVPDGVWEAITMDFIVGLPVSQG